MGLTGLSELCTLHTFLHMEDSMYVQLDVSQLLELGHDPKSFRCQRGLESRRVKGSSYALIRRSFFDEASLSRSLVRVLIHLSQNSACYGQDMSIGTYHEHMRKIHTFWVSSTRSIRASLNSLIFSFAPATPSLRSFCSLSHSCATELISAVQ